MTIATTLIALLLSSFSFSAQAAGINAQTLNPSVSDHYVLTEDAYYSDWPKYSKFYLGVNYNYVNEPLVALSGTSNDKLFNVINSIQTFDFLLALKATKNLGFYVSMPIHQIQFQSNPGYAFPTGSQTALGDVKLMAKIALSDPTDTIHWALAPEVHLPTGSTENFVSDGSVYGALRLVAETWLSDSIQIAFNAGYGYASDAFIAGQNTLAGFDDRNRVLLGIGSLIKINDRWGINVEGEATPLLPTSQSQDPNDVYAGLRFVASRDLILTAGGAIGKIGQAGGENYRALAGLRYSPGNSEPTPTPIPRATPEPTPEATPWPVATPAPKAPLVRAQKDRIEILSPVLFENDSAKLLTQSRWILNEVIATIHKYPARYKYLYIDGHTNYFASRPHNQRLSVARAKSVKAYLVEHGIPSDHLFARGFGKDRPLYPKSDPRAIEGNRRVEFIVKKP